MKNAVGAMQPKLSLEWIHSDSNYRPPYPGFVDEQCKLLAKMHQQVSKQYKEDLARVHESSRNLDKLLSHHDMADAKAIEIERQILSKSKKIKKQSKVMLLKIIKLCRAAYKKAGQLRVFFESATATSTTESLAAGRAATVETLAAGRSAAVKTRAAEHAATIETLTAGPAAAVETLTAGRTVAAGRTVTASVETPPPGRTLAAGRAVTASIETLTVGNGDSAVATTESLAAGRAVMASVQTLTTGRTAAVETLNKENLQQQTNLGHVKSVAATAKPFFNPNSPLGKVRNPIDLTSPSPPVGKADAPSTPGRAVTAESRAPEGSATSAPSPCNPSPGRGIDNPIDLC